MQTLRRHPMPLQLFLHCPPLLSFPSPLLLFLFKCFSFASLPSKGSKTKKWLKELKATEPCFKGFSSTIELVFEFNLMV